VEGENIPILVLLYQQHNLSLLLTITIPVMATPHIQAKSLPLAEKREQGISQNLKEQSARRGLNTRRHTSVADPGCLPRIQIFPSRIPDPHQRI
jgi:hypothetical protein